MGQDRRKRVIYWDMSNLKNQREEKQKILKKVSIGLSF